MSSSAAAACDSTIIKVDMDENLIATKTAASPLATCAKYLVLTLFGAAVVFGAAYAALELYNHNNPTSAGARSPTSIPDAVAFFPTTTPG